jgi:hypothetical protein
MSYTFSLMPLRNGEILGAGKKHFAGFLIAG